MANNDFAIIGLNSIGKNLALNLKSRKYSIAVFDDDVESAIKFSASCISNVKSYKELKALITSLSVPRKIFLCTNELFDSDVIENMVPHLGKSDTFIDMTDSSYLDVKNLAESLTLKSIRYLDVAVTGPRDEILSGAGLIVGGTDDAFSSCSRVLRQISREYKGYTSCIHSGIWGTGHYTKIIHDSIEASIMQIIADGYYMLRSLGDMKCEEIASAFVFINEELDMYLLKITSDILEQIDGDTDTPIIDYIIDDASTGTNSISAINEAIKNVTPGLMSTQAIMLRYLSGQREQRRRSTSRLYSPAVRYDSGSIKLLDSIKDAMKASMIIAYTQGFDLLTSELVSGEWNYGEDEIARVWSGASTIRSSFMNRAHIAYNKNEDLLNLMHDDYFANQLKSYQKGLREIVMLSAKHAIPAPSFMSALCYYDSMRSSVLSANLIQSQLNYMGRDTVKRYDAQGDFNVDWVLEDNKKDLPRGRP